ncbi:MAG: SH3 domain-containing protein [Bacilli bacterium]|nr:SH3 domain-containing protein [Bacilli bacterium]
MKKNYKLLILFIALLFIFSLDVQALTGIVNVNDSLTLRDRPTTSGSYITSFYNNTELNILDTNAGTGNGCDNNWYKVNYGNYTGYSCGTFIKLNSTTTVNNSEYSDDSYVKEKYDSKPDGDGTILCYEDTGDVTLRSTAGGSSTGKTVSCGVSVKINDIKENTGNTCPYYYNVTSGGNTGWICGYFVNTTKLSKTAQNYYYTKENLNNYYSSLKNKGFPDSYLTYLAEIHARHTNWTFEAEKINLNYNDVVNAEGIYGRNLLEGGAFDIGYYSMDSNTYNIETNKFSYYPTEYNWYNASKEAIAYYMDPRNYLNEKYIFAFESLKYNSAHDTSTISQILSAQSFWPTVYKGYSNNVETDIVDATKKVGISSVHIASRIKQEISGLSTSDPRLGGTFTYNSKNYSGYYNFFNINVYGTNKVLNGMIHAMNNGWNTPYNGIYGGSLFIYNEYVGINQDTMYYEKFDISTNNGHYDHQYMQNLAAAVQETNSAYKSYVSLGNYLNKSITFTIPVYNNMSNYAVTAPKLGNPNNYLKELKVNNSLVSGFKYNTYNYNVYLKSDVKSVSINATPIVSTSKVNGTGNITINSNNQTQKITITSQNGKNKTYTINFIREEATIQDNNSNTTSQNNNQATNNETKPEENMKPVADIMNHSGFKYNGDYLFGISVGTNVAKLISNVISYNKYVTITIKSANNNVKTEGIFKTGDTITITGSDGTKTYTAVIYGDINGDGQINKDDCLTILRQINGYTKLNGAYSTSADANKDGKIDKDDCLAILRQINGYTDLNK